MFARVTIETAITGVYCLHQPDAVAQLQAENLRSSSDWPRLRS